MPSYSVAMTYSGPPRSIPPPPEWQPPTVVRPAPPRALPGQDHDAIDAAERSARRTTLVIGAVAGVVMVFVMCLLAGRMLAG